MSGAEYPGEYGVSPRNGADREDTQPGHAPVPPGLRARRETPSADIVARVTPAELGEAMAGALAGAMLPIVEAIGRKEVAQERDPVASWIATWKERTGLAATVLVLAGAVVAAVLWAGSVQSIETAAQVHGQAEDERDQNTGRLNAMEIRYGHVLETLGRIDSAQQQISRDLRELRDDVLSARRPKED